MTKMTFTQEKLEKLNPLLKKMRERHEKAQQSRGGHKIKEDPEYLKRVQDDIQRACALVTVSDDILDTTHPRIADQYLSSLEKIKADRDALLKSTNCQKASLALKQFQGKSKMTLSLLRVLNVDIDLTLFHQLTHHQF